MTIETADRLVQLRKAHNLSQEKLAEQLGVSRQAVSKWECAESTPDMDNLLALSALYNITLDELIRGKGVATPVAPGNPDDPLPEGSYFEHKASLEQEARDSERRRFPYPVLVTIIYLMLGFFANMWHPGWLVFLTIPLFYLPNSKRSPLKLLSNPVMITIIYLLLGFECGLWHPGWMLFLAIPILNAAIK